MDAVEFLKNKERMCREFESCSKCPADDQNNGLYMTCDCLETEKPEEFVAIVEKWSAEHPVNTRQSEFLKMFPNAKIKRGGVDICPCRVDTNMKCPVVDCNDCRKEYWLEEID